MRQFIRQQNGPLARRAHESGGKNNTHSLNGVPFLAFESPIVTSPSSIAHSRRRTHGAPVEITMCVPCALQRRPEGFFYSASRRSSRRAGPHTRAPPASESSATRRVGSSSRFSQLTASFVSLSFQRAQLFLREDLTTCFDSHLRRTCARFFTLLKYGNTNSAR